MTYTKPEVVTVESPIEAIHGSLNKGPFYHCLDGVTDPTDPNYGMLNASVSSYEADE